MTEYLRAARQIEEMLSDTPIGDIVPSGAKLVRMLRVSHGTIMQAIRTLEESGFLFESRPGKQRVMWRRGEINFTGRGGIVQESTDPPISVTTINHVTITGGGADEWIKVGLHLSPDQDIALVTQKYTLGERPVGLQQIYLPPPITQRYLPPESPLTLLQRVADLPFGTTDWSLTVQPASQALAQQLDTESGKPIVVSYRTVVDSHNVPIASVARFDLPSMVQFQVLTREPSVRIR